jgi:hypothetical protein
MSAVIRDTLLDQSHIENLTPTRLDAHDHRVRDVDDWFIEELAREAVKSFGECFLVTTDGDTRADFNGDALSKLGLRGLRIEEALDFARRECAHLTAVV